jgi:hypothetical protein
MALRRAEDPNPVATDPVISQATGEIAELQTVMRLIDVLLEEVSTTAPPGQRALIPNALLNLAVEHMLAEQTPGSAATILYRLAELIASGTQPHGCDAFPLNGQNARREIGEASALSRREWPKDEIRSAGRVWVFGPTQARTEDGAKFVSILET